MKIEENLWIKKIFEKWSGKKTRVLKFIWQLELWKLNLRIRILEIKIWKLFKDGILKNEWMNK